MNTERSETFLVGYERKWRPFFKIDGWRKKLLPGVPFLTVGAEVNEGLFTLQKTTNAVFLAKAVFGPPWSWNTWKKYNHKNAIDVRIQDVSGKEKDIKLLVGYSSTSGRCVTYGSFRIPTDGSVKAFSLDLTRASGGVNNMLDASLYVLGNEGWSLFDTGEIAMCPNAYADLKTPRIVAPYFYHFKEKMEKFDGGTIPTSINLYIERESLMEKMGIRKLADIPSRKLNTPKTETMFDQEKEIKDLEPEIGNVVDPKPEQETGADSNQELTLSEAFALLLDRQAQIGDMTFALTKKVDILLESQRLIAQHLDKLHPNDGSQGTNPDSDSNAGGGDSGGSTGSGGTSDPPQIDFPYLSKLDQWEDVVYDSGISKPVTDMFGVDLVASSYQKPEVVAVLEKLRPSFVRVFDHIHKHNFNLPVPELGYFEPGQGYDGYDSNLPHTLVELRNASPGSKIILGIEDMGYGYPPHIGKDMGYPNKFPNIEALNHLGIKDWSELVDKLVSRYAPAIKSGAISHLGFNELRSETHPGKQDAIYLMVQLGERLHKLLPEWKGYLSPTFSIPGKAQRKKDAVDGPMTYEKMILNPSWVDGFAVNAYGTANVDGFDYSRIVAAPQDGPLAARNRVQIVRNLSHGKPVFWTEAGYNSDHTSQSAQANAMIHDWLWAASQGVVYINYGVKDGEELGKPLFDYNGFINSNGSEKKILGRILEIMEGAGKSHVVGHVDTPTGRRYQFSNGFETVVPLAKSMNK